MMMSVVTAIAGLVVIAVIGGKVMGVFPTMITAVGAMTGSK